jgi:hypothetical protein
MKVGDVVEVLWVDAVASEGWHRRDDLPTPEARVVTVGYLLRETPGSVVVANSMFADYEDEDGTVGGITEIPKGMLVEVRPLRCKAPSFDAGRRR